MVQDDVVEDVDARLGAKAIGEPARKAAAAVEHFLEAARAKRSQRGIDAKPRACREDSGVQSIPSRGSSGLLVRSVMASK
jgi:hypothetical protein